MSFEEIYNLPVRQMLWMLNNYSNLLLEMHNKNPAS